MINIIGYIGMFCLMFAAIPQAIKSIKQGHANGIALIYLILLLVGFIFMLVFVITTTPKIQLIANYTCNIITYSIILYFKIFPRKIHE